MKFRVVVADPPWAFGDGLKMSAVKRDAPSNYAVIPTKDLMQLGVKSIAANQALLDRKGVQRAALELSCCSARDWIR